jgi:uncharacterized protein (TIGR03083 family)
MDVAAGYRDGQQRVTALVTSLDEDRLSLFVPLNPAWRVRDVVAHLVGLCEDALAGNYPDFSDPIGRPEQAAAREAWTAAQVERRRDCPMEEMLQQWESLVRRWEVAGGHDSLDTGVEASALTAGAYDVACHLHDLRHALDQPGDRNAATTAIAFAISRGWLGARLDRVQLSALRMRCADREWVIGHRPVGITVDGDRFELFRAITGRRTRAQLLALDWDSDPTPFLNVLSPYPLPQQPVLE